MMHNDEKAIELKLLMLNREIVNIEKAVLEKKDKKDSDFVDEINELEGHYQQLEKIRHSYAGEIPKSFNTVKIRMLQQLIVVYHLTTKKLFDAMLTSEIITDAGYNALSRCHNNMEVKMKEIRQPHDPSFHKNIFNIYSIYLNTTMMLFSVKSKIKKPLPQDGVTRLFSDYIEMLKYLTDEQEKIIEHLQNMQIIFQTNRYGKPWQKFLTDLKEQNHNFLTPYIKEMLIAIDKQLTNPNQDERNIDDLLKKIGAVSLAKRCPQATSKKKKKKKKKASVIDLAPTESVPPEPTPQNQNAIPPPCTFFTDLFRGAMVLFFEGQTAFKRGDYSSAINNFENALSNIEQIKQNPHKIVVEKLEKDLFIALLHASQDAKLQNSLLIIERIENCALDYMKKGNYKPAISLYEELVNHIEPFIMANLSQNKDVDRLIDHLFMIEKHIVIAHLRSGDTKQAFFYYQEKLLPLTNIIKNKLPKRTDLIEQCDKFIEQNLFTVQPDKKSHPF